MVEDKEGKRQTKQEEQPRIGVYVCHCGLNIAGSVDCADVAKYAATLPNVVLAQDNRYTCSDQGQAGIKKDIKEQGSTGLSWLLARLGFMSRPSGRRVKTRD